MKTKKKLTIVTATRAEYGLLKPLILELRQSEFFETVVAVTGMHLSNEFGLTYKEIEADGIQIDKKIEILLSSDSTVAMSKTMGLALISFAEYFEESRPDGLIVLGDRFELLAICSAAMNARIPIMHLHGGEVTEGAIDESVRHAITKMSYLHFACTETYRRRIIQMGEEPERVFNVGALGVENAIYSPKLSKMELEKSLGVSLDKPYAVVTFHPVTLEDNSATKQITELLDAMVQYPQMTFIITGANADVGGRDINATVKEYATKNENIYVFDSLGVKKYLSAIKYAEFVLGNSSSGILEVPSFGIPTINVGDRQKGRIQAESIINCKPSKQDIIRAIDEAMNKEFREKAQKCVSPYGKGNTAEKIVKILEKKLVNQEVRIKKHFYDI